MQEIKKFDVFSVSKVFAIIFAIIGLIAGLFFAVFSIAAGAIVDFGGFGASFGVLGIIIFPIIYGVMGFVMGAIGALIYNLVAAWIGGVEIEFKEKS